MTNIVIISDTHSRYDTVSKANRLIETFWPDLVIHCGDIEDADTVWKFQPNTHFVWGNCDHEKTSLRQAIHGIGATLHEYMGTLQLGDLKVAFLHGDDAELLSDLEHSGEFDFIFHGHTHVAGERTSGKTRIINPGALHRVSQKTFAVLEVESGEVKWIPVE